MEDLEWNLYHDNDDRNYNDINKIKELEQEVTRLKSELNEVRYIYKPEVKDIYLWNGRPVLLEDPAWGHVTIWDFKDGYLEGFSQYSDEIEEIYKNKIGKIIRPRWNKEIKIWHEQQRGLKYDKVIHT